MANFQDFIDKSANTRVSLRITLMSTGAKKVTVAYSGYGDSGQIDEVFAYDAADVVVDIPENLSDDLENVAWALVSYFQHDGFENNEGGNGEIEWDLVQDHVTYTHNDAYVEYQTMEHEC
jgi:hypothetical protein